MGIPDYSTTAADNAGLGWGENMMPGAVNDGIRQIMADIRTQSNLGAWRDYRDGTPDGGYTYVSATSFKVSGADCTAAYAQDARVRAVGSSTGDIVGTVVQATYSAPDTTVVVAWDSGSLINESLTIYLSVVSPDAMPLQATDEPDMSVGTSGYYTLPGGVMVQWGVDSTLIHLRSVTFPTPFPNACWVVKPAVKYGSSGVTTDTHVNYANLSATGFKQVAYSASGATINTADPYGAYSYIAIGN